MEGLWRTSSTSLRPRDDAPTSPLPRTVLRSLLSAGRLRPGSRVIVCGEEATPVAAFLDYLGMEVAEDRPEIGNDHDAVVCLCRNLAAPGDRTLLSQASVERTLRLARRLRPGGTLLFVNHLGRMSGGHDPECLERHFDVLPGRTELAIIPERPFLGFLRESARPAYAVATWKAAATPLDLAACRRVATVAAFATACCPWAAETVLPRRAA